MKVFFTASQRGKEEFGKYYQMIFDSIKDLSFNHVDDEIVRIQSSEFYKELQKGGKRLEDFYHNTLKNIKLADIIIFECSLHSLSIGFMIQKALELNKPVIALYIKGYIPYFLAGMGDEKFILVEYTKDNLKQTLKKVLDQTKALVDTRFNFFISPKLLSYLQKTSKEQGITKSAFIRNLILKHMRDREKPQAKA